jgi:hypothetical protein
MTGYVMHLYECQNFRKSATLFAKDFYSFHKPKCFCSHFWPLYVHFLSWLGYRLKLAWVQKHYAKIRKKGQYPWSLWSVINNVNKVIFIRLNIKSTPFYEKDTKVIGTSFRTSHLILFHIPFHIKREMMFFMQSQIDPCSGTFFNVLDQDRTVSFQTSYFRCHGFRTNLRKINGIFDLVPFYNLLNKKCDLQFTIYQYKYLFSFA